MRATWTLVGAAALVAACGSETSEGADDTGSDAREVGAAIDSTIDSTIDTTSEATSEAETEAGVDAETEAGADADAGADVEVDGDADECGGISYAVDVQGIWNLHCAIASCHTGAAAVTPDLSPSVSWSDIVGVPSAEMPSIPYVAPGDPTNSFLYEKITSGHPPGDPLTDREKNDVLQWILCGAPR